MIISLSSTDGLHVVDHFLLVVVVISPHRPHSMASTHTLQVRIDRKRMLDSAYHVIQACATTRTTLDVEFFNEVFPSVSVFPLFLSLSLSLPLSLSLFLFLSLSLSLSLFLFLKHLNLLDRYWPWSHTWVLHDGVTPLLSLMPQFVACRLSRSPHFICPLFSTLLITFLSSPLVPMTPLFAFFIFSVCRALFFGLWLFLFLHDCSRAKWIRF